MREPSHRFPNVVADDVLAAVLATEEELARRLRAAEDEAQALVERARTEAIAAERDGSADVAQRIARLDAECAERLRTDLAAIARDAESTIARYDGIGDAEIIARAVAAAGRVLGDEPTAGAP
jgi:hypothetical protein